MATLPRLAFIGLGIMGQAMAMRLVEADYRVTVFNRTKAKASRLLARGVRAAATPAAAAAEADVVFLCVTNTPDVQQVCRGPGGIIESARTGMIVVDHSTISPDATVAIATELAAKGTLFLDAPVSGGDVGARNGTLSIMVGGEQAAYERVEPILRRLGQTITYCGPSGHGQLTKLTNQILVSVTNMAVCEALVFARKHGLNLEKTIAAVGGGAGGSWQLANLGPKMVAGDFRPGFTVNLQQKDLHLVLEAAERTNTSLAATSLVHQLFAAAQAAGHGKDGTQSLYTVVDKLSSPQ
jgi:3-hydroxyisobutyrate dehydrogenase